MGIESIEILCLIMEILWLISFMFAKKETPLLLSQLWLMLGFLVIALNILLKK